MQVISIFSGIEGFGLASDWMGWELIVSCEIEQFPKWVIDYRFPNTKIHDNVKTLTRNKLIEYGWKPNEDTILVGGPPCQPASTAGKRLGENDDRWLWPEAIRLLGEIKPTYAIFENPTGIISLGNGKPLHWILSEMEAKGYKTERLVLPACSLQAWHQRQRLYIIAYSDCNGYGRNCKPGEHRQTPGETESQENKRERNWNDNRGDVPEGFTTNSDKLNGDSSGFSTSKISQQQASGICELVTNSTSLRQPSQKHREKKTGRIASESLQDYWQNFPTQSPIFDGAHGISSGLVRYIRENGGELLTEKEINQIVSKTISRVRTESIKAGGNAVVPQVIFELFKAIENDTNIQ